MCLSLWKRWSVDRDKNPMSRDFLKEIVKPQFPNIDIVAIHGLNAWKNPNPAEHTWTAEGKLWLRDYLPQTAPNARVLLAGYNSNAALGTTTLDIRGQANNLLNRLDAMRKEDPDRPLIFICHSMGGLVVKQAIITASSDNNYKKIVSSTYGIVFFGTPHNGGNHAGIGSVAAKIARAVLGNPNSGFMEVLQSRSYALDNITESFRPFLEDFQFISFYETKNFRHTRDLIVPKKSAVLGLAPEREKQIGLAADHSGICKFSSPSDPMYQQVSDNITTMIDEAIAAQGVRRSRVRTSGSDSSGGSSVPPSPLGKNMSIINGLRNCVNQVGKGNDSRTFGNGNTTNQLGHGGNFGQSSGEDNCITQISIEGNDLDEYIKQFWPEKMMGGDGGGGGGGGGGGLDVEKGGNDEKKG